MKIHEKLEAFASRELEQVKENLIVPDDRGGYTLFGRYRVVPYKQRYQVRPPGSDSIVFGSKKSAFSWCVADKLKQYNLARTIEVLDQKKQILEADILCRRALANRSKSMEFKENVDLKIQPKIVSLNAVNSELEKCVNSAKYWQIRGFSNETNRSGRTQAI